MKLGDGTLEEFRASGLGSATAVPLVPSIQPLPLLPGPDTVRERIDSLLRSLEVLAPYGPSAILCFTGPGTGPATATPPSPASARSRGKPSASA